ncbi:hypothetical protein ACI1TN_02180 [Lactococcus garvieae]|uniref:hypothetical protein n=1 Tax=Lactococcus TaxID=1357 RepID=UPI0022E5BDFF|nr:hypothetical protein [Lactococcus petauri]
MTQETAKERIYREALEKTRDRLDGFEELYANKEVYYASDELTGLVEKGLSQASKIPVSTDSLLVEKLQEQLNTAKKALTEIDRSRYGMQFRRDRNPNVARQALAAIGGDDDNY